MVTQNSSDFGTGLVGQVLTSNGEPLAPSFQSLPGRDFAYVTAGIGQAPVAVDADILFDGPNGPMTAAFTHAVGTAGVTLVNGGILLVIFSVSGTEANQFALFLNGVLVPSSLYGAGAGTEQNTGICIFDTTPGQVLTLRNHSSVAAVTLAMQGGTQANVTASMTILTLA